MKSFQKSTFLCERNQLIVDGGSPLSFIVIISRWRGYCDFQPFSTLFTLFNERIKITAPKKKKVIHDEESQSVHIFPLQLTSTVLIHHFQHLVACLHNLTKQLDHFEQFLTPLLASNDLHQP